MISDKKISSSVEKLKYLIGTNAPKGLEISDVQVNYDTYADKTSIYQYDVVMEVSFFDFPGIEEIEKHLNIIKNQIYALVDTYKISSNADLVVGDLEGSEVYYPVITKLTTGFMEASIEEKCTYSVFFNVILD